MSGGEKPVLRRGSQEHLRGQLTQHSSATQQNNTVALTRTAYATAYAA